MTTATDADTSAISNLDSELPLKVLCSRNETDEVNLQLPILFSRFRDYMANIQLPSEGVSGETFSNSLYEEVYQLWVLTVDTTNSTAFINSLRSKDADMGSNVFYMYLGLYLFVVWYFFVEMKDPASEELMDEVKKYVRKKLEAQSNRFTRDKKMRFLEGLKTSKFHSSFKVDLNLDKLRDPAASYIGGMLGHPLSKTNSEGMYKVVKVFRNSIKRIVCEEFKELLSLISRTALSNLHGIDTLAVGGVDDTKGYLSQINLAHVLFDYNLKYDLYETILPSDSYKAELSTRKRSTCFDFPIDFKEGSPSIFLAYFGNDSPGSVVTPLEIEAISNGSNVASITIDNLNLEQFNGVFNGVTTPTIPYIKGVNCRYHAYGVLEFNTSKIEEIKMTLKTENSPWNNPEEVQVISIISSFGSHNAPVLKHPDPNSDPILNLGRLSIDNTYPEDKFTVAPELIWPSDINDPNHDSESNVSLNQIILEMVKFDFNELRNRIRVNLIAGGIGRPIESNEQLLDPGGPTIESHIVQTDSGSSGDGALARYAWADLRLRQQYLPPQNLFIISSKGFVSQPSCTWGSLPQFLDSMLDQNGQLILDQFDNPVLYVNEIEREIRPFVDDLNNIPRYNSILCAFRAFAIAEAVIQRVIQQATLLESEGLIQQDEFEILKDVLTAENETMQVSVPRPGDVTRSTGIVVNYTLFHKYARAFQ